MRGGVALLSVIGVIGCTGRRPSPVSATARMAAVERLVLTMPPGVNGAAAGFGARAAISPNGHLVATAAQNTSGVWQIYLNGVDGSVGRAVPGTEDAAQPFFSADGDWLGFIANGKLKKVPVNGGDAVALVDVKRVRGASWGGGDVIVLGAERGLTILSAAGGAVRPLTTSDTAALEFPRRWPLILPDGKHVLYTAWGSDGFSGARIGAASIENGETKLLDIAGTTALGIIDGRLIYAASTGVLMAVPFDTRALLVTGDPVRVGEGITVTAVGLAMAALSQTGALVYQTSMEESRVVLAQTRGASRPLLETTRRYKHPALSPDGGRLAIEIGASPGDWLDVWMYNISSRSLTQFSTAGVQSGGSEWSPDGKRIIFWSRPDGGRAALWWRRVDGRDPAEPLLTLPGLSVIDGVLTPDGQMLLYTVTPDLLTTAGTKADVWYRRLNGDTTPRRLLTNAFSPRVSPDGRWVSYTSDDSGVRQVYVQPFPGPGERIQVSLGGGAVPMWSRDGRRLLYTNRQQLIAATLTMTPSPDVTRRDKVLDLEGRQPGIHPDYDVTSDSTQFVVLRIDRDLAGRTIVVPNWMKELHARLRD